MKKWIAIGLLIVLFVQAIPVLHVFSDRSIFYSYVDEDKADEVKLKLKKDTKDYIAYPATELLSVVLTVYISEQGIKLPPPPYLEFSTPPPNIFC